MAEWSLTLACIEWLLIFAAISAMPRDYLPPLNFNLTVIAGSLIMLFTGWRGLMSGHPKRMGSLVLVSTNLFMVVLFSIGIVWS